MELKSHPSYDPAIPAPKAADYLGIHYKTLLTVTRQRRIPVIRSSGGRLSYRLSDLNAYLDSQREEPRQAKPAQEIDWGA